MDVKVVRDQEVCKIFAMWYDWGRINECVQKWISNMIIIYENACYMWFDCYSNRNMFCDNYKCKMS